MLVKVNTCAIFEGSNVSFINTKELMWKGISVSRE